MLAEPRRQDFHHLRDTTWAYRLAVTAVSFITKPVDTWNPESEAQASDRPLRMASWAGLPPSELASCGKATHNHCSGAGNWRSWLIAGEGTFPLQLSA
jgi:hypothetical protein